MARSKEKQLHKQAGEYLVAAELLRRGVVATTFTGNMPDFDIFALNSNNKAFRIQVKTIQSGSWQLDADRFLKISISANGKQHINGKKEFEDPNYIYIFVWLEEYGKDEFFIVKPSDIQQIIYKYYSQHLEKYNGIRPKDKESKHTALAREDLKDFKDKWELITNG